MNTPPQFVIDFMRRSCTTSSARNSHVRATLRLRMPPMETDQNQSKNVFVQFGQPYRNAHPEHFHRSVAHGLAVVAAGAHPNLLGVLSRGAMARGLADASEGYTHARLRLMAAGVDGR